MTRSRQLATLFGIAAATLTASAAFAQPQISSTDLPSDGWYTDPAGFSTFSVRFSEDVLVPAHDAVRVRSTLSGEVLDTSYSYDALSRSLQVTVDSSSSLFVQRLLISIDYSITSAESGLALDGEIQSLQNPAFPSGNGKPGGRAVFVLNVLPGDANRDGRVDIADENALLESLGTASGDPGFDPMADMNRDGFVNAIDVVAVIRNQGESIQLSTTDANVVELLPDPDIPLNADVNEVRFAIAVAVQPDSVDARALFVTDLDGAVRPADSVQLSPDNSTLIFGFDPPLEQCSQNTLGLAPSFLGSAGELASPGVTAVLSGIEPLGDPILDPIERSTTSRSVTISGFATNATTVEISGPGGVFTVQANNGNFGADVDLDTNRLNRIFVTPISSCGVRGLARTVEVIQDETPPNVFIDLPVQGQQIQAPATDVAGRVGDLLSGFDGLTVLVNGIEAEVDIGIGTNGTFFLPSLPLDPDTNTEITVEASDTLGNRRSQSITVQRIEVPENAPRFSLSENAGNNQQAPVLTELSEPIRVRLIDANGAPLADKLVSFTVLRSDGMISKSAGSEKERIQQVRTDASGFASVYWTLGNDAGCGNNRLGVTSTDVAGTVLFCASALPGPTNQINIGSGNNQRGELGAPLADALRAWVSDACNGIEGIPVTFEIVRGDGLLNGDPVSTTIITGPTGHAEAEFTFGTTPGNNIIRADYPGNPTGPAEFVVFGLERDPSRPTIFTGVVQNNSSQPIADAEIELELNGEIVAFALSDEDGRFSLTGFPGSGAGHLHVSGLNATSVGDEAIPPLTFPELEYEVNIIANANNSLGMPVLLPRYEATNFREYSTTEPTVLEIAGVEGLRMIIEPGSMTLADGTVATDGELMALNQVHHDDIPMPMPDGAAPPFAWTIFPPGANFNPPITVEYPNISGLPPGAIAYFLQFDHETGSFEIVTSASVSEDGSRVISDPGGGIPQAGWGCNCPPYSVTAECCTVGCSNEGSISSGEVTGPSEPVALGETLTFQITGVEDSGGEKACPDGTERSDIAPATPSFTWEITTPSGIVEEGTGSTASVRASQCGPYSVSFFATVSRDCAPGEKTVGSGSSTVGPEDPAETLDPEKRSIDLVNVPELELLLFSIPNVKVTAEIDPLIEFRCCLTDDGSERNATNIIASGTITGSSSAEIDVPIIPGLSNIIKVIDRAVCEFFADRVRKLVPIECQVGIGLRADGVSAQGSTRVQLTDCPEIVADWSGTAGSIGLDNLRIEGGVSIGIFGQNFALEARGTNGTRGVIRGEGDRIVLAFNDSAGGVIGVFGEIPMFTIPNPFGDDFEFGGEFTIAGIEYKPLGDLGTLEFDAPNLEDLLP